MFIVTPISLAVYFELPFMWIFVFKIAKYLDRPIQEWQNCIHQGEYMDIWQ